MKKILFSVVLGLSGLSLLSCANENQKLNDNTGFEDKNKYDSTSIYYQMEYSADFCYLNLSDNFYMLKSLEDPTPRVGNVTESLDYMEAPKDLTNNDYYIAGDKYDFTFLKTEILYLQNLTSVDGGNSRGTPCVGPYVESKYVPATMIQINESLIERDSSGYITNIDLSGYDSCTESLVWYSPKINLNYIVIERTSATSYNYLPLSEYSGDVYASVQDNIVFALYAYDLSIKRK